MIFYKITFVNDSVKVDAVVASAKPEGSMSLHEAYAELVRLGVRGDIAVSQLKSAAINC